MILFFDNIPEAAMQPFQSTEGPLGDSLAPTDDSRFFFRPGEGFEVSVLADPREAREAGPGLLEMGERNEAWKGKITLREGLFVDSVGLNRDPFEVREGSEKFEAWKRVFEGIGRELE